MRHGSERRARLGAARLYLCVPARPDLRAFLDAVLDAGVDVVQLRDKTATDDRLRAASAVMRAAADRHDALFVLNDRPDLAVEVGADGVHVGQGDIHPGRARRIVGPERLIGRSTHSAAEIDRALEEDVDYLGVGPVAATPTKPGRAGIGLGPVRHAATVATIPFFVTGGMAPDTVGPVLAAGAHGVVVVRALAEAEDPAAVARGLVERLERPGQAVRSST